MIRVTCHAAIPENFPANREKMAKETLDLTAAKAFFDAPEYLADLGKRVYHASTESVRGLACLAGLLRAYGLTPPVRLARNEAGRPYFPDYPALDFNITHTKGNAFCVLSDEGRVGIDAESIRDMKDAPRVADRFFSEGERQMEFFTAWTRKESYLKYLGDGFSVPGGIAAIDTTMQPGIAFHTRELAGCRVTVCTDVGKQVDWAAPVG